MAVRMRLRSSVGRPIIRVSSTVKNLMMSLPGKNGIDTVLLPVDSKFPVEDYSRLVTAEEAGDVTQVTECKKSLENEIKSCVKEIQKINRHIDILVNNLGVTSDQQLFQMTPITKIKAEFDINFFL